MANNLHRRQFHLALAHAGISALFQGTAFAADGDASADVSRVLVVVQLAGGNDGLNTLIPYTDDRYYRLRPRLGIGRDKVLKLDESLGLHPECVELHRLYHDAGLGIVTNVGYPNPDRSHFKSMDVWETATPPQKIGKTGWIGRYFDGQPVAARDGLWGLRIGDEAALSLRGERPGVVTFANPSVLQSRATGPLAKGLDAIATREPTKNATLDAIQRTAQTTRQLSRRIDDALRGTKTSVVYPPFALCQSLNLVARCVAARLPTRVYFVTHGGFDTHAAQAIRHAGLLQELSQALSLFRADLKASGNLDRVLLMTFSEFGRRVAENKQGGTDHGTANVMFFLGGKVKPGLHGRAPDLGKLDDQGDLIHQTDFRAVYGGVMKHWLRADPAKIVGEGFAPLPVVQPS